MRSLWFRLLVLAIAPLACGSTAAHADWWPYTETVYTTSGGSAFVVPTSYVATSYVVPTAYVVPSSYSYVVPTVYSRVSYTVPEVTTWTPTSYGTTYVPTSYYVRERVARRPLFSRLFPRRSEYIVPTTIYYPTTTVVPTQYRYYAPTVFEYPVISEVAYRTVPTSTVVCDDTVVTAAAPSRIERPVVRDEPVRERAEAAPRDSSAESEAEEDRSAVSSKVPEAPAESSVIPKKAPASSQPKVVEPEPAPESQPAASPPVPPAAPAPKPPAVKEETRSTAPAPTTPAKESGLPKSQAGAKPTAPGASGKKPETGPGAAGAIPAPTAPGGEPPLPEPAPPASGDLEPPLPTDLPKSRQSLKPVLQLPRLTSLKGRVLSETSETPEEGVRVTVSSRTRAFEDRIAYSNQAGRFSVKVPDGDWTVKVTMPSGRVYSVYEVTVTNGVIVDDQGREVPGLLITR